MTTSRPVCPFPCAGSFCPFITSDPECMACDFRDVHDAYKAQVDAWLADQAEQEARNARADHTGASDPYSSPAPAGWGCVD
jgi:hypothetical protein